MNLQLEWVDSPRESWIEDIESMADGYPFEKRKRDVLNEDRPKRCRSTWDGDDSRGEFLAGFFEKKLVGWIRLRPQEFLSDRLNADYRVADWELIQRNRDDVRGLLLEAIRERYPDSVVQFSQPSQNRTARSFLVKQPDVVEGPTDLYLGRSLPSESSVDENDSPAIQSLGPGDSIEEHLPAETGYFSCRNLIAPDRRRELLTDRIKGWLERGSVEVFVPGGEHGKSGIAVVDRHPRDRSSDGATARVPYLHLPGSNEGSDQLLGRVEHSLNDTQTQQAEVRLDEPSEREHDQLLSTGYQSLSKRMYFLRLPEDVRTPLE